MDEGIYVNTCMVAYCNKMSIKHTQCSDVCNIEGYVPRRVFGGMFTYPGMESLSF